MGISDKNVSAIMTKFEAHCNPWKNVAWECHQLIQEINMHACSLVRQSTKYVTDLRTKAKSCEFGTLTDRDRIVGGVCNQLGCYFE